MAMKCYCFVSEGDSIAGPRIIQAMREDGATSHLFFPPYRAPLDAVPRELCRNLSYSLGCRDYLLVISGQGVVDVWSAYAPEKDDLAIRCRELARKRISLWIEGYPEAKLALSHSGNVYPRWGYGVMNYLLKYGVDWRIFRAENLGGFIYYLEWCIRTVPGRFKRYSSLVENPPEWYRELFPTPPPRPVYQDQRWNPYHLPTPKTLDPQVAERLRPSE